MPRYDTILLDADNTIWDFDRAEHTALGLTLIDYDILPSPEVELSYKCINSDLWSALDRGEIAQEVLAVERFRRFLKTLNRTEDPSAMNQAYLSRLSQQGIPLEGAEAFCRSLAEHCTLAIVTNGLSQAQHGRFDRCSMKDVISKLYISQEIGCAKPQKAFFDHVLADMGITDTSRVVVIGDNLGSDILGAQNAGLDAIWYNPKGHPCRQSLSPRLKARSYQEILEFVLGA